MHLPPATSPKAMDVLSAHPVYQRLQLLAIPYSTGLDILYKTRYRRVGVGLFTGDLTNTDKAR
jgi:hypothetical protein